MCRRISHHTWALLGSCVRALPDAGRVRLERRIELRAPARLFPWRLPEESLPERPLTGAERQKRRRDRLRDDLNDQERRVDRLTQDWRPGMPPR